MASSGRYVTMVAVVAATCAVGCGGCEDPDGPGTASGPPEIDGLLLVDNGFPPPANPIVLLDPRTGAVSSMALPRGFALAPDLKRVAYRAEDGTLVLAEIGLDGAGAPTFTTIDTVAQDPGLGPLVFNAQGDRVITDGITWDLVADEVLPFGGLPAPDGRHLASGVLHDDRSVPMAFPFEGPVRGFSSDGQWAIASDRTQDLSKLVLAHVPSRSIPQRFTSARLGWDLPRDPKSLQAIAYAGSDGRGRLVFARGGRFGQVIRAYPCGDFGEGNCYEIVESPQSVVPITRIRPGALVDGAADATEVTPLTALEAAPRPADAQGFEWGVIAISPDDARAIVQYRPYRIEQLEPSSNVLVYAYLGLTLYAVELGGDGALAELVTLEPDADAMSRAIDVGCAASDASLYPSDVDRLRASAHVRFLDAQDFVCASDVSPTPLAYIGGQARVVPRPGDLVTLDGASLLGVGPVDADGLCQQAIAGGPVRCTPTPIAFTERPVAQVGIDLVPRASSGPVVTAASHRAAVPGTTVRVLGYGFGTSGAVRLGEQALPASAITAWSDTAIELTVPPDAPANAPVIVEAGGATSAQRHVWLGRSEAWTGAPVVPLDPIPVRQGITRIAFPGAGGYGATLRGLDQIFPFEPLVARAEGASADHLDVMVLATPPPERYRWVSLDNPAVHVYRPLDLAAGLPTTPAWQPIAETTLAFTGNRFHTTGGKLALWNAASATLYLRTFATAGVDWQVGAFSTFTTFPRMPGLSTAVLDGDELWTTPLRRRTGWGELDAGVLYPIFADGPAQAFPPVSVGARGETVAMQLQETSSPVSHSTHVSTDGGATFTQVVAAQPNRTAHWQAVVEGARPGIYGYAFDGTSQVVARVSPAGAYSDGIGPALPAGVGQCAGGYLGHAGWLLCHDQAAGRLFAMDTSVATGATWVELGGARAGHLTAVHDDRVGSRLLVGTDTGEILASTDLAAWSLVDDVALGPIQLDVEVQAIGVLPAGHLVAVVHGAGWSQSLVLVRTTPP